MKNPATREATGTTLAERPTVARNLQTWAGDAPTNSAGGVHQHAHLSGVKGLDGVSVGALREGRKKNRYRQPKVIHGETSSLTHRHALESLKGGTHGTPVSEDLTNYIFCRAGRSTNRRTNLLDDKSNRHERHRREA